MKKIRSCSKTYLIRAPDYIAHWQRKRNESMSPPRPHKVRMLHPYRVICTVSGPAEESPTLKTRKMEELNRSNDLCV